MKQLYSNIAQCGNRLNFDISLAQQVIARLALADSKAMKGITKDSKQVAIMTRNDSTDMHSIAAVTLIFLPGTFTAVRWLTGQNLEKVNINTDVIQHHVLRLQTFRQRFFDCLKLDLAILGCEWHAYVRGVNMLDRFGEEAEANDRPPLFCSC